MGRLTRDPETRYGGSNNTCVSKFSLAVDRRFKRDGEATADFFNCTAFGKQGEFVERYLKKGTKILLSGRVENNNYTNKEGQKVYSVQVIAEEIEFAESKAAAARNQGEYDSSGATPPPVANDGFMTIPDDVSDEELPFN